MTSTQPSIIPGIPRVGRYLSFNALPGADPAALREAVESLEIDGCLTVGLGESLVKLWDLPLEGIRPFPALSGPGVQAPSTQCALWCWLRGDDGGDLVKRTHELTGALSKVMRLDDMVDGFKHGKEEIGRDLTGYEDGTENPIGDEAVGAAFVADNQPYAGSSFVAVQQWIHDLDTFAHMPQHEQDHVIGRRLSDNEEIEDAPDSAHVKRTEQESFTPEAFVLRRSMPTSNDRGDGLMFVAFGKSLDAFEIQLKRMMGLEDGITDALFRFSHPTTGAYYWCPPISDGRLKLNPV